MNALEYIDIEQNSDEWKAMRCGLLTSSSMPTVMANNGKAFGEPAKKLAINLALERITGRIISSQYSNEHMKRGHEQEPIARELYEFNNFLEVQNGGFFMGDKIGCSPDGLVGLDGLIEIKCVVGSVHYANIIRNNVDPAYKWQCLSNLMLTGRDWIDFVSYSSDFPDDRNIFIYRMNKDDYSNEIKMIDMRINEFLQLVESIILNINK